MSMGKTATGLVAAVAVLPLAAVLLVIGTTEAPAATDPGSGPYGAALKPGSVPAAYVVWLEKASGACDLPQLTAPLLAAQDAQESGWQPNAVSPSGAEGLAQFMPGTWRTWGGDDDGTGADSPLDPADAIMAQGRYMCSLLHQAESSGYPGDPVGLALAGYNAGWGAVQAAHGIPDIAQTQHYVSAILAAVPDYTAPAAPTGNPTGLPANYTVPAGTSAQAAAAITWALSQVGGWYSFGGDCTQPLGTEPAHRCDCSSLVQQAWLQGGVRLPRTTYAQVLEGESVDPDDPAPGDLVFAAGSDGTAASPGHVGLFIGDGLLVEAPRTGLQIRVVSYASWRDSSDPAVRVVAVRRV